MVYDNTNNYDQKISLCDALDRLLNHGIAISGDIVVSVAGVELLYIGLRGLLCSVDALDEEPQSMRSFRSSPMEFPFHDDKLGVMK